jgi:hypothetical protein
MDFEAIRKAYQPKDIRLLFVGESPPESGKFFYLGSPMTTYTQRAFETAFSLVFETADKFLRFFQEKGCYLDDLSLIPVDGMPRQERERVLKRSVSSLAERIIAYEPEVVAVVLKKIAKYVDEALWLAGLQCEKYVLPFPGHGHQKKYVDQLTDRLEKHLA